GRTLAADLERLGVVVEVSDTLGPISEVLVARVPNVCIIDPRERSVAAVLGEAHDRFPAARLVVITATPSLADAFCAGRGGAAAYLPKPVAANSILCAAAGEDCLAWNDSEVP